MLLLPRSGGCLFQVQTVQRNSGSKTLGHPFNFILLSFLIAIGIDSLTHSRSVYLRKGYAEYQGYSSETRYSNPERECLAVVRCLAEVRWLITGSKYPTCLYTDHSALRTVLVEGSNNYRMQTWAKFEADVVASTTGLRWHLNSAIL